MAEACQRYRTLIASDSLDFADGSLDLVTMVREMLDPNSWSARL